MFRPKTFREICNAMQTRAEVEINGFTGTISGISIEDGSGRCYNVTMQARSINSLLSGELRKVFFRE